MLAVLIYLVAMGLPLYLLFHFQPRAWYWHALAIAGAISLGFIPIPAAMQKPVFDVIFACLFIALLIWGVCGLLLSHSGGDKHQHKHA
jgi:hypothetical protein